MSERPYFDRIAAEEIARAGAIQPAAEPPSSVTPNGVTQTAAPEPPAQPPAGLMAERASEVLSEKLELISAILPNDQRTELLAAAGSLLNELTRLRQRVSEVEAERGWACKAQRTADPPQDCDYPHCGCDPNAERVMEALREEGWLSPQEVRDEAKRQLAEANAKLEAVRGLVAKWRKTWTVTDERTRGRRDCADELSAALKG